MEPHVSDPVSFWQALNGVLNFAAVIWLVRVEKMLTRINTVLELKEKDAS